MIGELLHQLGMGLAALLTAMTVGALLWYGIRRQWGCLTVALVTIFLAGLLLVPPPAPSFDACEPEPPAIGETVTKQYNWTHGGRHYQLSMELSTGDYYSARQTARGTVTLDSYALYLVPDDLAVIALAESIEALSGDPATLALSFVRSLDYRADLDYHGVEEYPKYPIETLMDSGGDCEDLAILYVSVMHALDRPAVLLAMLDTPMGGHMAAGISGPYGGANVTHDRTVYYYAETTAAMDIGRVPMEISWDDMTVHVLGAR